MKLKLRLASQTALMAVLSTVLILSPIALTGCSYTDIQNTLSVAAEVANSAAAIVAPVSPEYGEYIGVVGKLLKDVSSLYAAYHSAAAADKPGILGKLHATLSTITANLQVILGDAHVKAAKLTQEIGVFVAIANSAVTIVLNHLPATGSITHVMAASASKSLPVIKDAKSAQDLAKAWNNAIGAEHPEAVVNAPHKTFGIF